MNRPLLIGPLLAATLLATAPVLSASAKSKTLTINGSYKGHATLLIDGNSIKTTKVKGTGSTTPIGSGSMTAKATGTSDGQSACVPWSGKGKLTGASGTISVSTSTSSAKACSSGSSGPVTITITGTAKVTGATGSAQGATGKLKIKGTLKLKDTSGTQSGSFKGKVSGTLTIK